VVARNLVGRMKDCDIEFDLGADFIFSWNHHTVK
jgi:hypothetical protein